MTSLRALEGPLRAWRSFRDVARATRTLAAARVLQWTEQAHRADDHLAWCEAVAAEYPLALPEPGPRPRVVVVFGTDLGLCGPLNRRLAERCEEAELDADPTVLRVVVGSRLAALAPLSGAVELRAPSSLPAARRLAAEIEDLLARLPEPHTLELSILLAAGVEGDGTPRLELRTSARLDVELDAREHEWVSRRRPGLGEPEAFAFEAHALARHARLVAAACRASTSENEARWRTMSRAYESAQGRIAEQERKLRKLRQELITQEMLEQRASSKAGILRGAR
jgi:F-type H+-transporting ATPase subunit gamma